MLVTAILSSSNCAAVATAAPGTLAPDVDGATDGVWRVETRPVPPPFLDLLLSGVLAPSRRLACDE
jgi:hypothetical protein